MFLKFATVGAAGVAVIAIALYAAGTFAPEKNLGREAFREHHGNKLELPKGSGSIRTVELYPDKRTRKFGIEDHADGTTSHYRYRPDGTLTGAVKYARADADGNRAVLRNSTMAADGLTYITDVEYYADGSVAKNIALVDDKTTTRRYFHTNGALARDQVMTRDNKVWKLTSEQAFRDDGKMARVFLVTAGVSTVDTIYGDNEVVSVLKTHDHKTATYKEVWFDTDGKTAVKEVAQTSSGTTVVVKRKDGTVSEKFVWWGAIKDSSVYVNVMDEADRKRIDQAYVIVEGQLRLRSVQVYAADGRRTDMVTFRTTGPEAGNVESEVRFDGKNYMDPHTQRDYRPDGTLESEKKQADTNTLISEKKFAVTQNVRAAINADWTKNRMVSLPPQVIEYVPEMD